MSTFAHRLDIDSDGHASVSCVHGPDDPAWFCVDDNGAVTNRVCWVSTWAPEWADCAAGEVATVGTGMIDVTWVGDHPEVVGFTPAVVR